MVRHGQIAPSDLQLPIMEWAAEIDTAVFPAQELERLPLRQAIAITVKTGSPLVERAGGHSQTVLVTCDFQRLYEANRLFSFRARGRSVDP